MPVSWPDEALKAQAVAAHNYALYCTATAAPDWYRLADSRPGTTAERLTDRSLPRLTGLPVDQL